MVVSSISYEQTEILNNILEIYTESKEIDLDMCYSKGNFYKNKVIKEPKYKIDINPVTDDTVKMDCRNTNFESESMKCIIFDPPFLATISSKNYDDDKSKNDLIIRRFGYYSNMKELYKFYYNSLKEAYRLLENNGILIFKCQDCVCSGKQYLSHVYICEMAVDIGFKTEDLFVLLAKSRMNPSWWGKPKHARKYHCYFLVLQKNNNNKLFDLEEMKC